MASALKNLSEFDESKLPSGEEFKIGIVVSDYHHEITFALYEACYDTLIKYGLKADNIHTEQVPGAFELPVGAKLLAGRQSLDAVICLGCVIKGETPHNNYINQAVASALTHMGIATGKPFVFGVLTPNTLDQAKARAGGANGNKGVEAAVTALRMIGLKKEKYESAHRIGFSS